MKISNEKTLINFANSKHVDKEGYLLKRGEVNKAFQKRYFKLKGNLLFYFDKRGGDLLGMIVLEGCVIELAENEIENYCFFINFVGNRKYILASDNQQDMESWMRALTCSGFDYMKIMVSEMQRQLEEFERTPNSKTSNPQPSTSKDNIPPVPPRRQNPFNKFNNNYNNEVKNQQVVDVPLRLSITPSTTVETSRDTVRLEEIRDDNEFLMFEEKKVEEEFNFAKVHELLGRPILKEIEDIKLLKSQQDQPLIVL